MAHLSVLLRRLAAVFSLLLVAASLHAQPVTVAWQEESPIRRDSVLVNFAASGLYQGFPTFLRGGQQYVQFFRPPGKTYGVRVRVNGGAWQILQPEEEGTFNMLSRWDTPPPPSPLPYTVEFQYRPLFANYTSSYITTLFVLPPAQRKFVGDDLAWAIIENNGTPHYVRRRSQIYLWTRGRTEYEQRDRPLLVVEGIDGDNKNTAATYLALGSRGESDAQGDTLFPTAQRFGADVGVLDFADGARSMEDNAQVVKGAVRFFRAWRARQNVGFGVVGVSMGGVVARYALADMEGRGEAHGVAHFVSLDAPQRGAVIDRILQNDIKFISEQININVPSGLSSIAGKQLLTYAAFDPQGVYHQGFFQRLRALNGGTGYPQQTDNIGVSFGSVQPNQGIGQSWVRLTSAGILSVNYAINDDIAHPGSLLPEDQASQWGPILGAIHYELDRSGRPDPTFIPYTSALDFEAGTAGFDTTLSANLARFHDRVPTEIVRPVLRRMGYRTPPPPEPVVPLAVTINGPYAVTSNPATWTASVNRLAPHGFTFSWRYRLDLNGNCELGDGELLRSTTTSARKKPGDVTPNLINQCVWTNGPAGPTFSYSIAGNAWLDVEVTATDGVQTVMNSRRVSYGSPGGGGGPLAARQQSEAADLASETEGVSVEEFEVRTPMPSVARRGQRLTVRFGLPEAFDVEVVVRDVLGRMYYRMQEARSSGWHAAEVPLSGMGAGVYLVTVRAGREQRTVRFVIQ